MRANNSDPRLRHLCSRLTRRRIPAWAVGGVAGALTATGIIYFLLWWPDAFPLLPGPPALDPWSRFIISAIVASAATLGVIVVIHNRKNQLLQQAERLAERGEQIRATRVLNWATGLGLEECARVIEEYSAGRPSSAPPRPLPEEVRRLAEAGEQLRAVERLRELSGVGLKEAMRLVEESLGVRPWWQELADDPSQKIEAVTAYREEHGVGLAEATQAVEEYIRGRGSRA
jgi:ribosomal protein L7/L12